MNRWIEDGVLPPIAPRVQFAGAAIARDAHGNALGGLRLPHVDVPSRATAARPRTPARPLSGKTEFFDTATLAALYPSQQAYEDQLRAATDAAVAAGFIHARRSRTTGICGDYTLGASDASSPVPRLRRRRRRRRRRQLPGIARTRISRTAAASRAPWRTGSETPASAATSPANGIVNGQDANAIQRHALGPSSPLFAAPENCDVSGNGRCNGQDANAVGARRSDSIPTLYSAPTAARAR
jgi:hypothetical protein